MGIDYKIAEFAKRSGANFAKTITVGRQNWWLIPKECRRLGLKWQPEYGRATYSEPFFKELGARWVDSVDIVDTERPTIIADLSKPWPVREDWTCVCDFGTAEHIADQATYWTNLHRAVKLGGTLLVVVPANQMCGHGLYQYSPEFFSRMVGFESKVSVVEYGWSIKKTEFIPGSRFQLRHRYPTYIFAEMLKTGFSFSMPVQDATTTHCKPVKNAGFLLGLPLVRRLQRIAQ